LKSRYTSVVDRLSDWKGPEEGLNLMAVDEFLTNGASLPKSSRIVNLCRRYGYLSAGYYCSLLAEARGQIPMPTVADVLSLSRKTLYSRELPELDETLRRTIKRLSSPPESAFYLIILFGQAEDGRFKRLAAQCFDRAGDRRREEPLEARIDLGDAAVRAVAQSEQAPFETVRHDPLSQARSGCDDDLVTGARCNSRDGGERTVVRREVRADDEQSYRIAITGRYSSRRWAAIVSTE